jgi:uncharacterized membrane protein HdeD (DUF308 family)
VTAVADALPDLQPPKPAKWLAYLFLFIGVVTIGFGVAALVYPKVTLLVISIIFGINFLFIASLDIVEAVMDDELDTLHRVLGVIVGLIGIVAGLIVLRHPFDSLAVILLVLGIYLVIAGIVGAIRALKALSSERAMRALGAIAEFTVGLIILAVPGISLASLAILAGIGIVFRGIAVTVLGFATLKLAKQA